MVAGQDDATAAEHRDPAGHLEALTALVYYDQVEDAFWEVASEDAVGGTGVGATEDLSVSEDLFDCLLLQLVDLVPYLPYLFGKLSLLLP